MNEALKSMLPEVAEIRDPKLAGLVLDTFAEALRQGGWVPEDLKVIPFTLLIPDCPVNLLDHTLAVTRSARNMAKVMREMYGSLCPIDEDLLLAGGLLHDVGKILEYWRKDGKIVKSANGKLLRHPFSGAGLATRMGLPDAVVHCIAVHAHEGDGGYRCVEAVLINHADFANFEGLKSILGVK